MPKEKKAPRRSDWHPADVEAALKKMGWSYRRLAAANGYSLGVFSYVAAGKKSVPVERIIARVLGLRPREIWPSRYRKQRFIRPELWGPKRNDRGSNRNTQPGAA